MADLVNKQRAQIKSTLMIEVLEMRRATLNPGVPAKIVNHDLRRRGRIADPQGPDGALGRKATTRYLRIGWINPTAAEPKR